MNINMVALTFAGLLVGNELAIAVFVHPVLSRQADEVHFAASTALAKRLGRVMPFWYALVVILTALLTLRARQGSGRWPHSLTASLALWVLSVVYTVTALVPINDRVASWTAASRPANWKALRHRWDLLHRARVLLLTAAFILLVRGALQ